MAKNLDAKTFLMIALYTFNEPFLKSFQACKVTIESIMRNQIKQLFRSKVNKHFVNIY